MLKKSNQEHLYRINTNFKVKKHTNKKGDRWTNSEKEEFRKVYATDRNLLNLTNMEIFKNRSLSS
jgi:hypothetical protein